MDSLASYMAAFKHGAEPHGEFSVGVVWCGVMMIVMVMMYSGIVDLCCSCRVWSQLGG